LKVLLVHNFYGSSAPSGENKVFCMEKALLESFGHTVEVFTRSSDEIRNNGYWGLLHGALTNPWNFLSAIKIRRLIKIFQPDIIHVHNTFPLISPSIFYKIDKSIPIVLTLHNYRIFCAAGVPMRDGRVCTECIDRRTVIPALNYGCYRNSRIATIPLAINIALHHYLKTWVKRIDLFIAFSDFQRRLMGKAGLPIEKILLKPNFCLDTLPKNAEQERSPIIVYVGRLGAEKGLISLIEAWREWCKVSNTVPTLRIIGDGPLRVQLETLAIGLPVEFMGQMLENDAKNEIANAQLLVLPSECYEGFPMVIAEAFSLGTPVAVSNFGPLTAIVEDGVNGIIFEPKNPQSLFSSIQKIWDNPLKLKELQAGARLSFEEKYSPEKNYQTLINIYNSAISNNLQKFTNAEL